MQHGPDYDNLDLIRQAALDLVLTDLRGLDGAQLTAVHDFIVEMVKSDMTIEERMRRMIDRNRPE